MMEQELEIPAGDTVIRGTLHIPSHTEPKACIVTCHGLLASRQSPKAVMLGKFSEKLGYGCMRFDFRGCGDSGGRFEDSISSQRSEDLAIVLDHVEKTYGIHEFGLFGSSLGGYVSLLHAPEDKRVKALVSVSSPYSMAELLEEEYREKGYCDIDGFRIGKNFYEDALYYDEELRKAVGRITCPVLFVQGGADPLVPPGHAKLLYEKVGSEKKLEMIRGADHSYSNMDHLFKLVSLAVDWFRRYL